MKAGWPLKIPIWCSDVSVIIMLIDSQNSIKVSDYTQMWVGRQLKARIADK